MHYNDTPGIPDICFSLVVLCVEEGKFVTKALWRFQKLDGKNSHLQCGCSLTLRAMKRMITIIPQTSPMMFRILAVLDASTATADSPRALAFCAFKKQVSKLASIYMQFSFLETNYLQNVQCCKTLKMVCIVFDFRESLGSRKQQMKIKKKCVQERLPTLQEQMIAAIPRGRQQHKVLKMDHPK